ncbi:hypothetical protein ART_0833 [Arthrobacter sp. PAMC 25486]|uniref:hypothetical protein n=1 Tax=Arthrobacter sp. PAMC 25486 TaxID=1494608 RepID=UPI0005363BF4|nr:hypothetical protein [Arthrobacter sp. PAMC 25486]AIY00432.1 hypothetical protein ART_0833 [Arthrobacter sp. PAMC 25486]
MSLKSPRACAELAESTAALPPGNDERFAGYALMGMPFSSGNYLAFRRFPASSIGPGYTALWLHRPNRGWTIYADAPPEQSCARYFGAGISETLLVKVESHWGGPFELTVGVSGVVRWDLEFQETRTTTALTTVARRLPEGWWQRPRVLSGMGGFMGPALHAGKMRLAGTVPNGQSFQARPLRVWAVKTSHATIDGVTAGWPHMLPKQLHLADFWLPQEGLFVAEMSLHFPSTAPETAADRASTPITAHTRRSSS